MVPTYFDEQYKLIAQDSTLTIDHFSAEHQNLTTNPLFPVIRTVWSEHAQHKHIENTKELQNIWKTKEDYDSIFELVRNTLQTKIEVIPASFFIDDHLFFITNRFIGYQLDVILDNFNCNYELFFLGEESDDICKCLVELNQDKRTFDESMGVLLIDRELDLGGGCLVQGALDSLFTNGFDLYSELDDLLSGVDTSKSSSSSLQSLKSDLNEFDLDTMFNGVELFDVGSKHSHKIPLFTNIKTDMKSMTTNIDPDQSRLIKSLIQNPLKSFEIIKNEFYLLLDKPAPKSITQQQLLHLVKATLTKQFLYKNEPVIKLIVLLLETNDFEKQEHLLGIQNILLATITTGDHVFLINQVNDLLEVIIKDKKLGQKAKYSTKDVLIYTFMISYLLEGFVFEIDNLKVKFVESMVVSTNMNMRRKVEAWIEKAFGQIKFYSQRKITTSYGYGYQTLVERVFCRELEPTHKHFPSIKSVFGRFLGNSQKRFTDFERVVSI